MNVLKVVTRPLAVSALALGLAAPGFAQQDNDTEGGGPAEPGIEERGGAAEDGFVGQGTSAPRHEGAEESATGNPSVEVEEDAEGGDDAAGDGEGGDAADGAADAASDEGGDAASEEAGDTGAGPSSAAMAEDSAGSEGAQGESQAGAGGGGAADGGADATGGASQPSDEGAQPDQQGQSAGQDAQSGQQDGQAELSQRLQQIMDQLEGQLTEAQMREVRQMMEQMDEVEVPRGVGAQQGQTETTGETGDEVAGAGSSAAGDQQSEEDGTSGSYMLDIDRFTQDVYEQGYRQGYMRGLGDARMRMMQDRDRSGRPGQRPERRGDNGAAVIMLPPGVTPDMLMQRLQDRE